MDICGLNSCLGVIILAVIIYLIINKREYFSGEVQEYKNEAKYYLDDLEVKFNNDPFSKKYKYITSESGYMMLPNSYVIGKRRGKGYYDINHNVLTMLDTNPEYDEISDIVENTYCCDDISNKNLIYQLKHDKINNITTSINQLAEEYYGE